MINIYDRLNGNFKSEFINRIDEIICFSPLSENSLIKIANIKLDEIRKKLKKRGIELTIDEFVAKKLATKSIKRGYGARPLIRTISTDIENPIAELIERAGTSIDFRIDIAVENEELVFKSENAELVL